MWHHELGKSTLDIYEEERLANLAEERERNAHLTDVATVLRALDSKRRLEQKNDQAAEVRGIALHSPTGEHRKLSPQELDRRYLATSAFLGIDPFPRSCDVATGPGVVDHASPTAQTEEDREYSEDVTAIIRGEESYGYRNR